MSLILLLKPWKKMSLIKPYKQPAAIAQPAAAPPVQATFTLKTAAQTMQEAKDQPRPKQLFGEFWFEGELCFLFASSNIGKTVLAVQIADAVSKGTSIAPFRTEITAQKVLYFDFELTAIQFAGRYQSEDNPQQFYSFSDNFLRPNINMPKVKTAAEAHAVILADMESCILQSGAKVVVIDNLTRIAGDTTKGDAAFAIMDKLDTLKKQYNLSILVLAHTPKRNPLLKITQNDLMGSSMLMSFADSCFSISKSGKDPDTRYIKQQKVRAVRMNYDENNVITYTQTKDNCLLKFDFLGYEKEADQLQELDVEDYIQRQDTILYIYQSIQNPTLGQIAKQASQELGMLIHKAQVKRILDKYRAEQEATLLVEANTDESENLPFDW